MTKEFAVQGKSQLLCKGIMLGLFLTVFSTMNLSLVKPAIAQSKQHNMNLYSHTVRKEVKISRQEAQEIIARYFDTTVNEISFEKIKLEWVKNKDHISQKPFSFKKDLAIGTPYYAIDCSYDLGEYDIAVHGGSGKIVKLILKKSAIF